MLLIGNANVLIKKLRRHVFVLPNYTQEDIDKLNMINPNLCDYIIWGYEICPTTRTKHLQGYVEWNKAQYGNVAKQILGNNRIHLEQVEKNRNANIAYCKKAETKDPDYNPNFIEIDNIANEQGIVVPNQFKAIYEFISKESDLGIIAQHFPELVIKHSMGIKCIVECTKDTIMKEKLFNKYNNAILRPWQLCLRDELINCQPDDRSIIWYVDPEGNQGKSWMCNYLMCVRNALVLGNAKSSDIAHIWNGEDIVVFDFSRSQESHINYGIIEDIKNGRVFSPKYNGKVKIYMSPHIVCFSNFHPELSKMSQDRWDIRNPQDGIIQVDIVQDPISNELNYHDHDIIDVSHDDIPEDNIDDDELHTDELDEFLGL
nr:putative replication associated protein [Crucivirus sp.]